MSVILTALSDLDRQKNKIIGLSGVFSGHVCMFTGLFIFSVDFFYANYYDSIMDRKRKSEKKSPKKIKIQTVGVCCMIGGRRLHACVMTDGSVRYLSMIAIRDF
tara:strand:+ start:337 stop:648 length:312 start_codon:yes stop_codon:yes gene_type:complete